MAGMLERRNQKGSGHGARNHRHAASSRLCCYFYAMFHVKWRPEVDESKKIKPKKRKKKR